MNINCVVLSSLACPAAARKTAADKGVELNYASRPALACLGY